MSMVSWTVAVPCHSIAARCSMKSQPCSATLRPSDCNHVSTAQSHVALDRGADQPADNGVGMPERHAAVDQPLGEVDGGDGRAVGRFLHAVDLELGGGQQPGQRGEGEENGVDTVEQRLLVLLEIA